MEMKKFAYVLLLLAAVVACAPKQARWSEKKAQEWYSALPWQAGCDYIPASAINQIEMWSAETFDTAGIDRELGWAEDLGFNTLRVYLSSVVYEADPEGMKARMDTFLSIASKHGIRPLFVIFDDCWNPESSYGTQPAPKTGIHNSGWVQDPSKSSRADTTVLFPKLEKYVTDIMTTFGNDSRILLWDLYNEPGNSDYGNASLPLLKAVFRWAQAVRPSQPLSAGVWRNDLKDLNAFQLNNSDITTYHCYDTPDIQQQAIDTLAKYGRPMICTEYMARTRGCTFQNTMPLLKKNNVGAINWGFVSGKTNTIYAWSSPMPEGGEPELWFHDIFRPDGTPYNKEETDLIKSLTR